MTYDITNTKGSYYSTKLNAIERTRVFHVLVKKMLTYPKYA